MSVACESLITGAGGNLGRAAIPALERQGHTLRLFDFRPLETVHEAVVGDVRDPIAVAEAVAGVDAVVHGAALHGVHLEALVGERLLVDQRRRHPHRA